jgi:hypothetical protein
MGLDIRIRGVVKSKTTKDPIKGIKVSVKDMYSYELTDSIGGFQFYVPQEEGYILRFEDIDGAENGSYKPKETFVDSTKDIIVLGDIFLDDAE